MLAAAHLSDRLSVDVQNLQSLRARAQGNDPETLRQAARQFEALMVQNMLKTMRQTRFSSDGDPFADSDSLRMYRELLDQHWAQKMTEGQGLGFAEMMVRQMQGRAGVAVAGTDTGPEADAVPHAAPVRAPTTPASSTVRDSQDRPMAAAPQAAVAAGRAVAGDAVPVQDHKRAFVDRLRGHAEAAARQTGVPAHFILGHAALESGWGKHEIAAANGMPSHNLFGIKASSGWRGGVAETLTTEYQNGLAVKRSERFRAYGDYTEAFADYARLLKERYGAAVAQGGDARAFSQAIASGGYATDPLYVDKLGRVIASVERVAT